MNESSAMKDDRFNYSIAFMRIFFVFFVICNHFYWPTEYLDSYRIAVTDRMKTVAVLIFIIISFYLAEKHFRAAGTDWLKKRAWRFIFPLWAWGVLYFIGFWAIDAAVRTAGYEPGLSLAYTFKDLLWQLSLGSDRYLCPPLWYQFDLVVLTVTVWIVYRYFNKYLWYIISLLGLISIGAQYFGLNYYLFGKYEYEVCYPLGRIMEVLPLAIIGLTLGKLDLPERLKKYRFRTIAVCFVALFISANGGLFTVPEAGFGYGGTFNIVYAVLLFILLYEIPFEKMPVAVKKILRFLSGYSFGVFCLHFGVGYCWNKVIGHGFGLKNNTLAECFCLYFICILVSWLISLIPGKYARQLVK